MVFEHVTRFQCVEVFQACSDDGDVRNGGERVSCESACGVNSERHCLHQVEDPYTAWRFREDVYAKLGMRLPSKPVKKVLFWLRKPNSGRSFYNLAEMLAIADKYNIPYTVVEKVPPDFISQVNLVADHGVIVAPHGAGLMNLMFMPPFGAVVEIFPYQTHHNLYSGIAAMVGVAHYPVHTYNGTETLSDGVRFWTPCLRVCVSYFPPLMTPLPCTELSQVQLQSPYELRVEPCVSQL
jgi:hypothetical protein